VAPPGEIPASVTWSFYLGAAAFIGSVLWTVFKSDEYPPEEFERYSGSHAQQTEAAINRSKITKTGTRRKFVFGLVFLVIGLILTWIVYSGGYTKELYIFGLGLAVFGLVITAAGFF